MGKLEDFQKTGEDYVVMIRDFLIFSIWSAREGFSAEFEGLQELNFFHSKPKIFSPKNRLCVHFRRKNFWGKKFREDLRIVQKIVHVQRKEQRENHIKKFRIRRSSLGITA